jgi:hypothetical protein
MFLTIFNRHSYGYFVDKLSVLKAPAHAVLLSGAGESSHRYASRGVRPIFGQVRPTLVS